MSLRNPFVLQCKSCNSIVCDSFSLLDYKNSSLIFNSIASTVTLDSSKHTDSDTVYSFIRCKCSNTIGKRYYTTNADMNGYSGMYFISKESVFSYMLGGNSEFKSVTLYEIAEDVEKLQKLCLFLYKKINNTK
ncbi:hypothetical protein NBO_1288g0005 [Nosema bombycis CQ1]|jgi:hypothetical protein|nr:hypothetical protein NBO_1288g0005 [Nosema bombycis CQ1]|eukprot:EOB11328.1 hypothetical protein NBO_1288g0005 [Nosema bombycis CQ1]